MKTDTALKVEAMTLLIKSLGELDAVSLVKSDRFDYTKWQRDLWQDKTIDIYTAWPLTLSSGKPRPVKPEPDRLSPRGERRCPRAVSLSTAAPGVLVR
jgi:hypothetical protein